MGNAQTARTATAVDDAGRSAIGRMTALLEAFGDELEVSLATLARRTGLPKSTVHRTTELMLTNGWLERSPTGYQLGTRLFELGSRVRAVSELRRVAVPFMEELCARRRWVVNLGVVDGTSVLYIEKLWGHGQLRTPSFAGQRFPANCTALGKMILATAPSATVDAVVAAGLRRRTAHTIADPRQFRRELAAVARRGYAIDEEEFAIGMRCCAVPIRRDGAVVAALSATGRLRDLDAPIAATHLHRAAQGIEAGLRSP